MPSWNARISIASALHHWWKDKRQQQSLLRTLADFREELWHFVRDSMPERRRQRYGDVEYDWDYRVNTTSARVGWGDRLLGVLHSPYQPTQPAVFHELLGNLAIDFSGFTFIDLGSGKGRVLLMASEYPFRRILGIELLPELSRVAQENITRYKSPTQRCSQIEAKCGDAREFMFPPEPTVLYLFNPLPRTAFKQMVCNLAHSLQQYPRQVYVLYHHPLLEEELAKCKPLRKILGRQQYSIYSSQ